MKCEVLNVNQKDIAQFMLEILVWIYFTPPVNLIEATVRLSDMEIVLVIKISPRSVKLHDLLIIYYEFHI